MKAEYIIAALLVANGSLLTTTYVAGSKAVAAEAKVKKAEDEARTYAGKFLDLQELTDENNGELNSSISMLQWQLEQCQEKK